MNILVFTEGTILMHKNGAGKTREQRIQDSIDGEQSIREYAMYVPIGDAPKKVAAWIRGGSRVRYLTSRKKREEIDAIHNVLSRQNFPSVTLEYRKEAETYADVAERIMPDVLIEDDCESIGGEKEMTYPHLSSQAKKRITSIIVKEFGGIDHLPDDPFQLTRT